jgi:hypothetical protein
MLDPDQGRFNENWSATQVKKAEKAHELWFCVPALPLNFATVLSPCTVQADSWAREPMSQLHLDEAARAGHPPLHREARDAPRARLLCQPFRVLQAGQPTTQCCFNQCCATGTAGNATFCLGKTRTVMHSGFGSGFGSVSNTKCNSKARKFNKSKVRWQLSGKQRC